MWPPVPACGCKREFLPLEGAIPVHLYRCARVLTLAILAIGVPAGASADDAAEPRLRLRINMYDYAGIKARVRAAAVAATQRVYGAIGVDIEWIEQCPAGCRRGFRPPSQIDTTGAELTVIMLTSTTRVREVARASMGSAPIGSRVVYAFFEQIRTFASDRGLGAGQVLGHVIAHEIGHRLLRDGHGPEGLMRSEWIRADVSDIAVGRLGFTPAQGQRIRATVDELIRARTQRYEEYRNSTR
jgi:hypothetical protein